MGEGRLVGKRQNNHVWHHRIQGGQGGPVMTRLDDHPGTGWLSLMPWLPKAEAKRERENSCVWSSSTFRGDLMFSDLPTTLLYLLSTLRPTCSRWWQKSPAKSPQRQPYSCKQEPRVLLDSSYGSAAVLKRAGPCLGYTCTTTDL